MSGCEPDCLHCFILKQTELYSDKGYDDEEIASFILSALCDHVFITFPFGGKIDLIANKIRDDVANNLKLMLLMFEQEHTGSA